MRPLSFLRWKKFALLRARFDPPPQGFDSIDEFVGLLKTAMDRRITQIGDFIDVAQFCHDVCPNLRRGDLAAGRFYFMNNIVHSLLENDQADRPFLEGLGQTAYEFAPVKGLVRSIALDHPQVGALDFFVSGVAISAFQA